MTVDIKPSLSDSFIVITPGAASRFRAMLESWWPRLSEAAIPVGAAVLTTVRAEAMKRKGPAKAIAWGAARAVARRPLLFGAAGLGLAAVAGVGLALYRKRQEASPLPAEPEAAGAKLSDAESEATTALQ